MKPNMVKPIIDQEITTSARKTVRKSRKSRKTKKSMLRLDELEVNQLDALEADDPYGYSLSNEQLSHVLARTARLTPFWEAIGSPSQHLLHKAARWLDWQGADNLDDIVRYDLVDSFMG